MRPRIYLDHAATTPLLPAAKAAMADALDRWANPSSPHREGRAARAALEGARERIKAALGWRHELIFTSGATEAAAIAMRRQATQRPAIISAVEHIAVLRQRRDVVAVGVTDDGRLDPERFGAALRERPKALVAMQHANSETGVLQPLEELVEAVDAAGGILFADCAQTAGKLPLPRADLLAVSAHKLGGPPGIGALLVRDAGIIGPEAFAQERGYRGGTENLPAILGFAAALDDYEGGLAPWVAEQARWRILLDNAFENGGGEVVGGHSLFTPRIPTIASYRLPGMSSEAQLIQLDMAGFAVSAGSACSSGSMHASHVLLAMGYEEQAAREVIRVSFGRATTWDEIDAFAEAWTGMAERRRA